MPRYRVENSATGHIFGEYDAEGPRAALDVVAREAGYSSIAHAEHAAPNIAAQLTAIEVPARDS